MTRPTVIITGCGYKKVGRTYKHKGTPSHDEVIIDGAPHKMNIGAASAYYLSKRGMFYFNSPWPLPKELYIKVVLLA